MPTARARPSCLRRGPLFSAFRISQIGIEPPFSASALLKARPTAFDVVARRRPSGGPSGRVKGMVGARSDVYHSSTNASYANVSPSFVDKGWRMTLLTLLADDHGWFWAWPLVPRVWGGGFFRVLG